MKMIGEKNVENMAFFSPALLKQQETRTIVLYILGFMWYDKSGHYFDDSNAFW